MRVIDFQSRNIANQLDLIRVATLRLTLKSHFVREIYRDRASRLSLNYILLSVIYLFLSLKYSVVLLVLGPLILGYPHLVASYRFLQKPSGGIKLRWKTATVFRIFIFLTLVSLGIRFVIPAFFKWPQLPYATYEILLSLSALAILKIKFTSITDLLVAGFTVFMTGGVLSLAWNDPLAFVGMALIFHNWVALGHWFFAAKYSKDKLVVFGATLIFVFIHVIVILGYLDSWISLTDFKLLSTKSFEVQGWALAPWTSDPMMWNRIIVLYTFGLSMHYFIWLRAIPQCLDQKSVPNSFRASLQQLRADCGPKTVTTLLLIGGFVAFGMWFHTALGGRIYFGIAMLHGWLEFVFLIIALSAYLLKTIRRCENVSV